jgi:hypothetical protein
MHQRFLTLAVVAASLTFTGPAWAHVRMPGVTAMVGAAASPASPGPTVAVFGPEALTAAASPSPAPWLLLVGGAIGLALTLRSRRGLALALLALLVFGTLETGVHSAHHLSDGDVAKCVVASVASQTGSTTVDPVVVERPADVVAFAAPAEIVPVALSRSLPPDLGRAPPAA